MLFKFIQGNYSLSAHDFHHILNYCARSPDPVVSLYMNNSPLGLSFGGCLNFFFAPVLSMLYRFWGSLKLKFLWD